MSQVFLSPELPGAYFEVRCRNPVCLDQNKKKYASISGLSFDYWKEKEKVVCGSCDDSSLRVYNIGFIGCKWIYQGSLDGDIITGKINYSLGYEIFQEAKRRTWNWLRFKVEELSREEIGMMKQAVNKSFDFDTDLLNLQHSPSQTAQRFNEKNKQSLKKEADKKKELIFYLKRNLKDQQKTIKKMSSRRKIEAKVANENREERKEIWNN